MVLHTYNGGVIILTQKKIKVYLENSKYKLVQEQRRLWVVKNFIYQYIVHNHRAWTNLASIEYIAPKSRLQCELDQHAL